MELLMDVLKIMIILILIFALIYTYRLGKAQKKAENEVGEGVVKHPVAKNPVFLSYILFAVFLLVFIFIVASYFS
jgi:ABC-type multidrug transport system permease subunit